MVTFNEVVTLYTYRRVGVKPMRRTGRRKSKTKLFRPDLIIYTYQCDTFTDLCCVVQRAFDTMFHFVDWLKR
jgi:hypothetical protein